MDRVKLNPYILNPKIPKHAVIGVDPGLSGAIAIIWMGNKSNQIFFDMPTRLKLNGKGREVCGYTLFLIFERLKRHGFRFDHAYVENVHSMPGQGVSSTFSFGKAAGVVEGVLSSMKVIIYMVSPQSWKREAGLLGSEKDAARTLVKKLFPDIAYCVKRKKDIGRADALLLAYFGQTSNRKPLIK